VSPLLLYFVGRLELVQTLLNDFALLVQLHLGIGFVDGIQSLSADQPFQVFFLRQPKYFLHFTQRAEGLFAAEKTKVILVLFEELHGLNLVAGSTHAQTVFAGLAQWLVEGQILEGLDEDKVVHASALRTSPQVTVVLVLQLGQVGLRMHQQ